MNNKAWTKQEENLVKRHYPNYKKLSNLLNRSIPAIKHKALTLKICPKRTKITPQKLDYIKANYQKMSARVIAKRLGCCYSRVYYWIDKYNLKKTYASKIKNVKYPNMTKDDWIYLAGLIDGDGSIAVYRDNKYFSANIVTSNTYKPVIDWILEKLQSSYKGKHTIQLLKKSNLTVYEISIRNYSEVKSIILKMLPYLKVRKTQAILLLRYIKEREKDVYFAPYTKLEKQIAHTLECITLRNFKLRTKRIKEYKKNYRMTPQQFIKKLGC